MGYCLRARKRRGEKRLFFTMPEMNSTTNIFQTKIPGTRHRSLHLRQRAAPKACKAGRDMRATSRPPQHSKLPIPSASVSFSTSSGQTNNVRPAGTDGRSLCYTEPAPTECEGTMETPFTMTSVQPTTWFVCPSQELFMQGSGTAYA